MLQAVNVTRLWYKEKIEKLGCESGKHCLHPVVCLGGLGVTYKTQK